MKNLVEIIDPHFVVDLMYAGTAHNMTGCPVYEEIGMGNHAYVHQDLWSALQKLIPYLEKTGRRLKIYEAFRPVKAHKRLFAVIPQDGFFIPEAERSPHCRATAVDVALPTEPNWFTRRLLMPIIRTMPPKFRPAGWTAFSNI